MRRLTYWASRPLFWSSRTGRALIFKRCWCCGRRDDSRVRNGYRSCAICKYWGSEHCPRGVLCRGT